MGLKNTMVFLFTLKKLWKLAEEISCEFWHIRGGNEAADVLAKQGVDRGEFLVVLS